MWASLMDVVQDIKDRIMSCESRYCVSYEDYVLVEQHLVQQSVLTVHDSHYLVDQILLTMEFITKSMESSFRESPVFGDRHTCNLLLLFFVCPLVRWSGCPGKWWPFFIANRFPTAVPPLCVRLLVEGIVEGHQWHMVYYHILVELANRGSDIERASFARRVRSILAEIKDLSARKNQSAFNTEIYLNRFDPLIGIDWSLLPQVVENGSGRSLSWKLQRMTHDSINIESMLILLCYSSKDLAIVWCLNTDNKNVLYFLDTEQAIAKVVESDTKTLMVSFASPERPSGWIVDDQKRMALPLETTFGMTFNTLYDPEVACMQINAAKQHTRKISLAILDLDNVGTCIDRSLEESPTTTQKCIASQEKSVVGDSQWTPSVLPRDYVKESHEWYHKAHSTPSCQIALATTESQNLLLFQRKRHRRQLPSSQQLENSQGNHKRNQGISPDTCYHSQCGDSRSSCACSTANTTYERSNSPPRHRLLATLLQMKSEFTLQLKLLKDMYHDDMDTIISSVERQKYY